MPCFFMYSSNYVESTTLTLKTFASIRDLQFLQVDLFDFAASMTALRMLNMKGVFV
jgi:hypothetical protein